MSALTVNLPVKISSGHTDTDVLALGITYGPEPGEGDLFREAALPGGWVTRSDDHPMWSHILDTHGRRRLSIFYGPNDTGGREAFTTITTVYDYVTECVRTGANFIIDPTWATPEAITEAAHERAREARRLIRMYRGIASDRSWHISRQEAIRDRYTKIAEQFERSTA